MQRLSIPVFHVGNPLVVRGCWTYQGKQFRAGDPFPIPAGVSVQQLHRIRLLYEQRKLVVGSAQELPGAQEPAGGSGQGSTGAAPSAAPAAHQVPPEPVDVVPAKPAARKGKRTGLGRWPKKAPASIP